LFHRVQGAIIQPNTYAPEWADSARNASEPGVASRPARKAIDKAHHAHVPCTPEPPGTLPRGPSHARLPLVARQLRARARRRCSAGTGARRQAARHSRPPVFCRSEARQRWRRRWQQTCRFAYMQKGQAAVIFTHAAKGTGQFATVDVTTVLGVLPAAADQGVVQMSPALAPHSFPIPTVINPWLLSRLGAAEQPAPGAGDCCSPGSRPHARETL
jgi:hypothetical protein